MDEREDSSEDDESSKDSSEHSSVMSDGTPARDATRLIAPHHKCDRHHNHVIDITYPSGNVDLLWDLHISEGHEILTAHRPITAGTVFVDMKGKQFTDDSFSNYWRSLVAASADRFDSHFPATFLRTSFIDSYTSGEGSMPEKYWAGEYGGRVLSTCTCLHVIGASRLMRCHL